MWVYFWTLHMQFLHVYKVYGLKTKLLQILGTKLNSESFVSIKPERWRAWYFWHTEKHVIFTVLWTKYTHIHKKVQNIWLVATATILYTWLLMLYTSLLMLWLRAILRKKTNYNQRNKIYTVETTNGLQFRRMNSVCSYKKYLVNDLSLVLFLLGKSSTGNLIYTPFKLISKNLEVGRKETNIFLWWRKKKKKNLDLGETSLTLTRPETYNIKQTAKCAGSRRATYNSKQVPSQPSY